MEPKISPEQEEINNAVDQIMARVALRRLSKMVEEDRQLEESKMTASLYMLLAFALFVLVMVILALAGARNAREIAQMLGIVPHRPVTMTIMLLSLIPSLALGGFAAYPILWPAGRHTRLCLIGAGVALALAALLYWSPYVVRVVLALPVP